MLIKRGSYQIKGKYIIMWIEHEKQLSMAKKVHSIFNKSTFGRKLASISP